MPAAPAAPRTCSSQTPQGGRSRAGAPPISAEVREISPRSSAGVMVSKQLWLKPWTPSSCPARRRAPGSSGYCSIR